jgi:erythromycin esterase
MGANAIWMADKMFAGKKVVIWAHTIHVARGFKRTPDNLQAGEVMHRHWGDAYKVVQFSAGGGEILEYVKNQPLAVPVPSSGSLEARLNLGGTQVQGLTASAPVDGVQFSYEYATDAAGKLGQNWDVLFFIPKVSPVRMTR